MMTIRSASESDLCEILRVIHESFKTIAQEFGLTRENCPTHTSFIAMEKLRARFISGMFICCEYGGVIAGCCCISSVNDGACELSNLAVLPEFRHMGIGRKLVESAEANALRLGADKITIGINHPPFA